VFAEILDCEAGFAQGFGGATGGDQFNAGIGQALREGDQAGFVEDRKQCALDFHDVRRAG
jgi:hypothetical protein